MALFNETPLSQAVREQSLGEPDPYLRQYTDDLGGTAFRRGVNQSLSLGADYFGSVAEAVGAQDTADDLYGYSDRQMTEARNQVAGAQTLGDIQGIGSAFEFGTNKAAESLPVSGTALGVGLATRNLPAAGRIAAAAAPIFPVTAGETSYSMRQDPNSSANAVERAVTATGAGLVSAGLEVLPEVSALGRVFSTTPSPAKTMAEAVTRGVGTAGRSIAGEALTEGAQDVVSRGAQSLYNDEIGVNPIADPEARASFLENAAAGAAGGAVFGGPAGVATTLQSLPETRMPELPSGDSLRDFIGNTLTPRAERIAPQDIPANFDDAVAAEMLRDQQQTERAQSLKDRLMQRGDLTPEEVESISEEVDLDPDAQQAVFDLDDRKATEDALRESIARAPTPEGRASRVNPDVPLEEVDTIVQQAGIQAEAASPAVRQWLSAYEPVIQSGQLDPATIGTALDVFGERGYSVLRAMAAGNPEALAAIDNDQASNGQLDTFLFQALKPEYRESIRPAQLRQLGNLVRGAAERGEGDIDSILETAFQNPGEVVAALESGVGRLGTGATQTQAATQNEEGEEVEFGDTQAVQNVAQQVFGDTRGNKRIRTGGLNIPLPVPLADVDRLLTIARNAEGLAPNSDMNPVPAVATLRRMGVDPADVAAEIGVEPQALRDMVFLEGTVEQNVDQTATFIRKLNKQTVEGLNAAPRDPSAGSYLGVTAPDGSQAAIDARRMVAAQVFGNRTPEALLRAFAEGVGQAVADGYNLQGVPDSLVLARYGRGGDEQVVTVGSARQEVGKRAPGAAEGNFPLKPEHFDLLRAEGYRPRVDFTTGELFLPKRDVLQIIERYAAAVASRNAAERGVALPAWTQALIDKHGTDFPASFGRASDQGTLTNALRGWAIDEGIDSKALNALRVRGGAAPAVDVAEQRRRAQEERQGPAMGRGGSTRTALDELSGIGAAVGKDLPLTVGETTLKTAEKRRREAESREAAVPRAARTGDRELDEALQRRAEEDAGRPLRVDPQELAAELGVSEITATDLPPQLVEASVGVIPITPERPYAVSQRAGTSVPQDFFNTAARAQAAHQRDFWATGTLPSGVSLQGDYAVLGKIASKGTPLQVVMSKRQGVEIPPDVQKLLEAYQRRGFTIRSENQMAEGVPVQSSPYSQRVMARVMGPTGDNPAHVVLVLGDSPSAALARRLGIPVIDLTNKVQQRIAGDILRAYDSGRRAQITASNAPAEVKAFQREGENRSGVDRSRDILTSGIEAALASNYADPATVDKLLRVGDLASRADNDFFDAAMASREPMALANSIDQLEGYFADYEKEQGRASLRRPGKKEKSDRSFNRARKYIQKVLPEEVRVLVRKMPTMSGLYSEVEQDDGTVDRFIELSAYAQDPLSTAYHESMHALISQLSGQEEQAPFIKALLKAANSPLVISQLRSLLKNETQALEQMVADPEERIAYMYEFWAAGKLNLASSVENWFIKLTKALRSIIGVLSNNEKAELYLSAFFDGRLKEPSAVNEVVMESLSTPERVLRALPIAQKTEHITRKVLETAHGRLKGYGNPALDRIADGFFADSSVGGQRSGYLQTVRDIVNLYGSQFAEIIRGSTEESLNELATALHTNKRPKDRALAEQYDQTKQLMRRLYNYMKASGVELPKVDDYFPQAWDKVAIEENRRAFEDMLIQNAHYRDSVDGKLKSFNAKSAAEATRALLGNNGRFELQEDLAGYSPFMEASNQRQIVLTDRALAAEYFDHDVVKVVTRYITQASKRGEYTRHFGVDGERLRGWLMEAKRYGLTDDQILRDVAPAIQAMEGTLGHSINPYARDFMSGIMTVLNLAVLPLAVFSSLIDPMGIVVRGGTVEQAWDAFKAGIRNIPQSVRKDGGKLDIQDLAETIGTVESQNVLDMLGDMYGSAYMSDWARKTNNLMFRYNLMEGWNTAIRSAATVAALDFIGRHARGEDKKNSARWLDELGLSKDTLVFNRDKELLWRQADIAAELLRTGRDVTQAADISRRTREGITRWVDGAVLRPHAAHRPSWASDPHWMLVWHLKQFTYSFQKTIIERVMHEARNGNYNPGLVLASYVPFMIAADYMRALVQGAGEEPEWKKGQDFGDTVWEGVQRAGILGVRQFALDGADNPAFVLGPAANYAISTVEKTADGEVTDAIIQALPGNALWKGW